MPTPLRRRVRALGETIAMALRAPASTGDNAAMLALSAATHGRQRVHLHYRAATDSSTVRDFDR